MVAGLVKTNSGSMMVGLAALLTAAVFDVGCTSEPNIPTPRPGKAIKPRVATAPAHGFGDAIAWQELGEGIDLSKTVHQPVMLVIHASWCKSCKALKPAFYDPTLAELSKQFVMVNIDQDEEPASQTFAVDGTYVPRVFFLDPDTGNLDPELRNDGRSRFQYYYRSEDDIVAAMKKALARHARS